MVNPMQIIQMIRQGYNPQQLVMSYLQDNFSQNPMGKNLLNLAQKGDAKTLEQIARNIVADRGLDYDKEFNSFKQQLGIK